MRILYVCTVAFLGVLVLLSPPYTASADESTKVESQAAKVVTPLVIPEADKRRRNPVGPGEQSLARGMRLFASQCAMCHGAKGDGQGELATILKIEMPDFTDPVRQKARTDGELFYIIGHGHNKMPADERLPEEWRWDIINHIRTLGRSR